MWLTAFFASFMGLTEFSVRLTSAICGILLLTGVLIYSYKKFGFVPGVAAFVTLAFNDVFISRVRSGNLDALTSFFVFLIFLFILLKSRKRFILLGICFCLLALTKGSFVLFPLSIFLLHELLFRRKEVFKNWLYYLLLFAIAIGIPGLWLYIGYQNTLVLGNLFITSYLFNSDQGASKISLATFKLDYISYMYYSLQRRYFFVFLLGFALLFRKIKQAEYFLLLVFPLSLVLFLSFSQKTNNWYLVPIMPFFSIIIAYAVHEILRFCKNNLIVKFALLALLIALSVRAYSNNIAPILTTASAIGEAESGKYLDEHAKDDEIIVRLDPLYPSMVYYSNRTVRSSVPEATTQGVWISREDLANLVRSKKQRWIVGTETEIKQFVKQFPELDYKIIAINAQETIAKMYD